MEQIPPQEAGYENPSLADPGDLTTPRRPGWTRADLQRSVVERSTILPEALDPGSGAQVYDEATNNLLAEETAAAAGSGSAAFIACPSIYQALRESHPDRTQDWLLEFDPRYEAMGRTTILPVDEHAEIPVHLHHAFDVVVADILFPDEQWVTKMDELMRLLGRRNQPHKFVMIAPAALEGAAAALGLRPAAFRPRSKRLGETDLWVFTSLPHSRRLHL